jgi:hypothetical protein
LEFKRNGCCPVDLKTTFKDTYLKIIKPSGTSQWAWDQQNQMWLINLPDQNSCTNESTQIGQQFIMRVDGIMEKFKDKCLFQQLINGML